MRLKVSGPAILVTAAFIGPGTVITASKAGASFGHALVWALVFSVFATLILQEMSARLGVVTGKGLGENLRAILSNRIARSIAIVLVTSAIVIGNAAYQSGNISGAVMGISALTPALNFLPFTPWPLIIGLIAFLILWKGKYALIEKSLMVLVGLMSLTFLLTFIITKPDLGSLFSGVIPSLPTGATLSVIALIGTTVVPYNLFLHAASASEKWRDCDNVTQSLSEARTDLLFSIPLGGLISIAIMSTAASAFFAAQIQVNSLATLAPSLEPLLGEFAPIMMSLGLLSAGLSSAITAPLAAAFALRGVLGIKAELNQTAFRAIWIVILVLGVSIATVGAKPIKIIWFAQVANGLLLPIITIFLLWVMNSKTLGQYQNNKTQNILGLLVLLTTLLLSGRSLMSAFGLL